MKSSPKAFAAGFVQLAVLGAMVFVLAGTFDYWQAWVYLIVFALSTWIPASYLLRTDPVALQRRMRAGPVAESRTVQKLVIAGWYVSLVATLVVSALDHRFGWSAVPTAICLAGDVLIAAGLGLATLVVVQNSHAAATVQVESGQELVSTGLYALVRHPMYTGNVITTVGMPLALGSYWGLVIVTAGLIVLGLRIRDEEKLLQQELDGYRDYMHKVRYRLVPGIW